MLTTSDFAAFLNDVHQRGPFPWQQALLDGIVEAGRWPDRIDVPTGLGKTSVLDIAVFLTAVRPDLARRRTFFVVDRRIVVDEAHQHAERLRSALDAASPGSVAYAVAQALRLPDDEPGTSVLEVTRMRGGVTWDARWLERPDRHAIITGTVDQVGSRLLFRGYGVTEYARSIDAALVGTDSLIVVDEAHIADPFVATTQALAALEPPGDGDVPALRRLPTVVTMSATAGPGAGSWTHTHTAADEAHEVAGRRLKASKHLHLLEVRAGRTTVDTVVPDALAALARSLAPRGVVGVVVNTVARARAVYERLAPHHDTELLTGRSRPVDRDYLLARVLPRIGMGRAPAASPLMVVATQTVEVGANIDLDALVTESAPFASLVQRFGRLNRAGRPEPAPALVVQDSTVRADDPVYGAARLATWQWLAEQTDPIRYTSRLDAATLSGGLPASPLALRSLARTAPDDLTPPGPYRPILDEATLDAWVRTSPTPVPDPPIACHLHGLVDERPTVNVVWRANLDAAAPETWAEAVDVVPPAVEEMLEVPLPAVRRWLDAAAADPKLSDRESEPDHDQPVEPSGAPYRVRDRAGLPQVLVYRGRGDAAVVTSARIRPRDLVVVPVEYGGCDEFGWHPVSTDPVVDVADLAWRRGRPVLRLGPYLRTVVSRHHEELADSPDLAELLDAVAEDAKEATVRPEAYQKLLSGDWVPSGDLPLGRNLSRLAASGSVRATLTGDGRPGSWPVVLSIAGTQLADDHSEAGSSAGRTRIPLVGHQLAVERRARQFAHGLGLPPELIDAVGIAARHHDEGKRDPRAQAMLWGGDRLSAEVADEPIAKSGMDPVDRRSFRQARERAGYPPGMRHEALSARMVAALLDGRSGVDRDLVVHLVASHHGRARPLLPPVVDPGPVQVEGWSTGETVDWDGPQRFVRLNQRYGRWGLALLETIVRLADIWCSARSECVSGECASDDGEVGAS